MLLVNFISGLSVIALVISIVYALRSIMLAKFNISATSLMSFSFLLFTLLVFRSITNIEIISSNYFVYTELIILLISIFLLIFSINFFKNINSYINAKKQLEISNSMLYNIVDNNYSPSMVVDEKFNISYINSAMASMIKANPESLINTDVFQHPFQFNNYLNQKDLSEIHQSKQIFHSSFSSEHSHFDLIVSPITNQHNTNAFLIQCPDNTDFQMLKKAIQERDERFFKIVESSPLAIFIHSDYKIKYINNLAAQKLAAKSTQELLGYDILKLVNDQDKDKAQDRVTKLYNTSCKKYHFRQNIIRTDGLAFFADIVTASCSYGNKPAAQVIFQDISSQISAENQLSLSESKQSVFLHNAPIGIFILNSKGFFTDLNRSALKLTQYSKEELLSMHFSSLLHSDFLQKPAMIFSCYLNPTSLMTNTNVLQKINPYSG